MKTGYRVTPGREFDMDDVTKANILLVEDNRAEAEATKSFLEKSGYEVTWVAEGTQALKEAKTRRVDCILLDLLLPDINGTEVCRWLKGNEDTRGIPIIILAGFGALFSIIVAAKPAAALPIRPRYLLLLAACPLLAACALTLMDFLRETGTCDLLALGTATKVDHGLGIWITLIMSGGAGLTALWGAMTRAAPELE